MEGLGQTMRDLDFYRGKRVLVTGHTGFKGTWLCRILRHTGAIVAGYALEPPTQPNLFALTSMDKSIRNMIGDVRNLESLHRVFQEFQPEIVIHMAAQPIVRTSYEKPVYTYETNVMGTVNLLECVRISQAPVRSVVNVTTDKVYENRDWVWGYREDEPLDGFDPYSNSKSCSELITHTYVRSYFSGNRIAVSTLRAGNVFGGGDFAQDRIIPDCIRAVQGGQELIVRNPCSIRPYQHVLEPLFAYLMVAKKQYEDGRFAGSYNIGPDECDCVTTGYLVELFKRQWGEGFSWITGTEKNAPHEAAFLKLDCSKLKAAFGWKPRWHIEKAVEETVKWTKVWMNGGDVSAEMDREIEEFIGNV